MVLFCGFFMPFSSIAKVNHHGKLLLLSELGILLFVGKGTRKGRKIPKEITSLTKVYLRGLTDNFSILCLSTSIVSIL